jgi:alkylation response protein AidB-like acyl-CoA dehydrogenase
MYTDLNKNLTEEQRILKETAHKFAKEVIRPASVAVDQMTNLEDLAKKDSIWWEARRKARQNGFHLAGMPKALGGFEAGPLEMHILLEEFGWGSPGLALSIFADAFPIMVALMYHPQNEKLMREIVMPFIQDVEGKIVSCAAIADPDHGSDALICFTRRFHDPKVAFSTKAVRDGNEWVISGQKAGWVSNALVATQALTWLSVYDSGRLLGGGIAMIPLNLPGVSRGKPIKLIGSHDFPQCELFFEEVRIPGDYLLIGPEIYESAIDNFLNLGGLSVAVVFTGLARAAFEEALTYAQQRVQGGKLLAEHQIIQSKLFDMFTKVEAARALSRAAFTYCMTTPNPIPVEYSTAAKVYCTQVAYEVAHEAVQIHGAYGLSPEFLVSKLFRDARGAIIGDGCNEVLGLKRIYNVYENYKP